MGEKHYQTYVTATNILRRAVTIEKLVNLVGESEISVADRVVYKRYLLIRNYMTQPFSVIAEQTGKGGVIVPLQKTVDDMSDIVAGKYDAVEPGTLANKGGLSK